MKRLLHPNLTQRIIGFIILGMVVSAGFVISHSEVAIEGVLMAQAKKQALVYLYGVEREILALPDPHDHAALQALVSQANWRHSEALDFSIRALYLFDEGGQILAHSRPGPHAPKDMSGELGEILRGELDPLAEDVEYYWDPQTGERLPKADIVLPVHLPDGTTLGLEVEVKLAETLELLRRHDDEYEERVMISVMVATLVTILFIWWVVRKGLLRPINHLAAVTGNIAAGHLDSRVTEGSQDELGRLGVSINHMADNIQRLLEEQEQAHLQMLQSLAKALEAKDAYTAGHSARVAKYSVKLGRHLGLSEIQLEVLKRGALMHDLGKIGIADGILNKPGPLSEQEYETMQRHPVYTAAILRPLKQLKDHAEIAAWHHERWDGRGYPDGLTGEDIPLLARIVAIADTWDAMTGDRVYRKGMPTEKALDILEREQDQGQFDPRLIRAFLEMVRGEADAHATVMRDMQDLGET